VLPRDFDTIEIPFPERGAPELTRWEDHPHEQPEEPQVLADPSA
jgi:hypothetical protein